MFQKLLNELKDLENLKRISVPIKTDKDGYLDRECPNDECLFEFKVHGDDWDLISDEKVTCPLCGFESKKDNWHTAMQIDEAKKEVFKHIEGRIGKAMIDDARQFNQSQPRDSFIRMSMTVSGVKPYTFMLPIPATEEMQLKIQCKSCNTRYAVIGSAFFCPCCGHNSAEETFYNSISKIEAKIKNLPIIRSAVKQVSKDEAELTCRSIIESSIQECVMSFQRFCEVKYKKQSPETSLKLNAFQNLEIGEKLWQGLFNESYSDWLTEEEFSQLIILFQKRHLLSHTEGMVDEMYINHTKDNTYKIGQRIIIKEKDVQLFVKLIKKIADILDKK
jgi:hypothetical protein